MKLKLSSIEPICRPAAEIAFENGNAKGFVQAGYSWGSCLTVVRDNVEALLDRGIFESVLVAGYTGGKTNHSHIKTEDIESMFFTHADPAKLRLAGEALPGPGPFQVFRGVSGESRISGFSWTSDIAVSCSFAHSTWGEAAVYKAEISTNEILCYIMERDEFEFIVKPQKIERLSLSWEQIESYQKAYTDRMQVANKARFEKLRNKLKRSRTQ